jgi:glutaconate CoA-transferase subunit B
MMNEEFDSLEPAEFMAIVLSRYLRGELFMGAGAYSQIPVAAMALAKLTHNPDLWWFAGGSLAINPQFSKLSNTATDFQYIPGSEYQIPGMDELCDYELNLCNKMETICCLGGLQIDKYGNSNLVCIGDYDNPKLRGPGSVGLIWTNHFTRVFYYVQHHSTKVFVEKVDFISGPGFSEDREKYVRPQCKGPSLVITPIAVMGFEQKDEKVKTMCLKSVHPGRTTDEVQSKTGFDLHAPSEGVPKTAPPTEVEVSMLRNRVDPDGVLKRIRCT